MADALFDTSVFIDFYRGEQGARLLFEQVRERSLAASYSTFTVFELWLGNMTQEEKNRHIDLLYELEEARFDGQVARTAADLLRGISSTARHRLLGDALIAATALTRSEPIYTRNARDFEQLGVKVNRY